MAEIPTQEPTTFSAGSTVKFLKNFDDYTPAGGWSLVYYIQGPGRHTQPGDVVGTGWCVCIPATFTATLPPGRYVWRGRLSKAGEVIDLPEVGCEVTPNPATVEAAIDARSHARKTLDAIEAVMEGRASRVEASYQITFGTGAARQLQLCTHAELVKAHIYYSELVRQEESAERLKRGLPNKNRILTRFR